MPFDGIHSGGLGTDFPQARGMGAAEDARVVAARLAEQRRAASEEAGGVTQERPKDYWADRVRAGNPQVGMTAKPPAGQAGGTDAALMFDPAQVTAFAQSSANKSNPR